MRREAPIVFMSMPFLDCNRPSLGIGLFQSILRAACIDSYAFYPNLEFASRIGVNLYQYVAVGYPTTTCLLGEWLFAPWLFEDAPDLTARAEIEREYVRGFLEKFQATRRWWDEKVRLDPLTALEQTRAIIPAFLDWCCQALDWSKVRLLGISSSYQQHVASLAVARRLKQAFPDLTIILGGANVEGPMGVATAKAFTWVDGVVSGDGDTIIVPLSKAVLQGKDLSEVPGVYTRQTKTPIVTLKCLDLDSLPYPDYRDFFAQLENYPALPQQSEYLPFETSRGCWWGQRSQCTFCGLSGENIMYRSKSPDRAVHEITGLWESYRSKAKGMAASDCILNPAHIQTVLAQLPNAQDGLSLFYETKVNLSKQQIEQLAHAGCRHIQPGIESLVTSVLRRMRKGTTTLRNIQGLKWFEEYGVVPYWNIIYGFPGETADEYRAAGDLVRSLFHLQPPVAVSRVRLDRFSPLHRHAEEVGLRRVRPLSAYRFVYGALPEDILKDLVYYFDYDLSVTPPDDYVAQLCIAVEEWKERHPTAGLYYFPVLGGGVLVDTRLSAKIILLEPPHLQLLDALDGIQTIASLCSHLGWSEARVRHALEVLQNHRLLMKENSAFLGLALRLGPYQPRPGAIGSLSQVYKDGRLEVAATLPPI